MKITVFGSGYVGLVTSACLAEVGNDVVCIDVDKNKIADLNKGIMPIYEPGLKTLVNNNQHAGRLKFTTDITLAVNHGFFQFIAVGTPPDEDGAADLQYVLAVAKSIAENMQNHCIVVDKSTVPVGTADKVKEVMQQIHAARGIDLHVDVVSNPEFLKEGSAIEDFMKPDRIIIGVDNPNAAERLKTLYAPFNRSHDRVIIMNVRSAELTKYAANAMLATKISFMNELANLAEHLGADIEQVRNGIGSDTRIGYSFIYPGCGFGGSCFPKDVKALTHMAEQVGCQAELIKAVDNVNHRQKEILVLKILKHYQNDLAGKVFALWGLSFKPKTDDMREAPSRVIIESLISYGACIKAFDPEAMHEAKRIYGTKPGLHLVKTAEEALLGANALIIVTEWKNFWSPDFELIKRSLKEPVIFDGRNLYQPALLKEKGITYYSIGRSSSSDKN